MLLLNAAAASGTVDQEARRHVAVQYSRFRNSSGSTKSTRETAAVGCLLLCCIAAAAAACCTVLCCSSLLCLSSDATAVGGCLLLSNAPVVPLTPAPVCTHPEHHHRQLHPSSQFSVLSSQFLVYRWMIQVGAWQRKWGSIQPSTMVSPLND